MAYTAMAYMVMSCSVYSSGVYKLYELSYFQNYILAFASRLSCDRAVGSSGRARGASGAGKQQGDG